MTWLIVLAAFMAIFGVVGYLRGWRAALFVLILTMLAVAITGRLGDVIIRYINAFGKGFRFLLSGGMSALTGEGGAEEALQSLRDAPALVEGTNEPLVLGLLFVIVVLVALLLSGIPYFKGKRSVLGLFLGLAAGYIVTGMIIRAVTPELSALVPLPFGFLPPVVAAPFAIQPGTGGPSLSARVLSFLLSLADRGLIATFLGIIIAIFLLLASRSGSRGAKKG
jgi:hypothetical protein